MQQVNLVLLNGKVWTGGPASTSSGRSDAPSVAQAIAIANGRIAAVGSNFDAEAYVDKDAHVIDLKGRLVVPGLIDSHTHFVAGGFQLQQVQLKDAASEEEFVDRVRLKAKTLKPGQWMLGGDWDEQAWTSAAVPTRQMIDAVTPDTPVFLNRYDWHASLANSLALKLANVTQATPDPLGGVIVRDASGKPTGLLRETAKDLVTRIIPRPTQAEMADALRAALAEASRVGLTSVHSITLDTETWNGSFTGEIDLLRRADCEGWLTCRVHAITPIAHWEKLGQEISRPFESNGLLTLGGVKAFADGSLGSSTAWMHEPYADNPANCGLPTSLMNPPSAMEEVARKAIEKQLQVCIHGIGDRAVSEILDIYSRLGGDAATARRFRLEHAQHVRPQDFSRFAQMGVIASMQPWHAIDDGRWAEARLGRERTQRSYAWRSMLDAGVHVAFGSDWPVAPLDPIQGIAAAVNRATVDGKHLEGWFPEQRIMVEEALRAYTWESAYAAFQEHLTGSISPGKFGGIVVLSDDLFAIPRQQIAITRPILTVVGGRIVYGTGDL